MSAQTILTEAAQADEGASAAFDCTAFVTLKLNVTMKCDHGRRPQLAIFFESAPSATGPWSEVFSKYFISGVPAYSVNRWPPDNVERVVLSGAQCDRFLRFRWKGRPMEGVDNKITGCAFTLAVAGDGLP